uniref:Uncharacterized protein n=1 Tax=Arundo donax TaxID=35708 RepID=A0A0A9FGJ2_ARUDO
MSTRLSSSAGRTWRSRHLSAFILPPVMEAWKALRPSLSTISATSGQCRSSALMASVEP